MSPRALAVAIEPLAVSGWRWRLRYADEPYSERIWGELGVKDYGFARTPEGCRRAVRRRIKKVRRRQGNLAQPTIELREVL